MWGSINSGVPRYLYRKIAIFIISQFMWLLYNLHHSSQLCREHKVEADCIRCRISDLPSRKLFCRWLCDMEKNEKMFVASTSELISQLCSKTSCKLFVVGLLCKASAYRYLVLHLTIASYVTGTPWYNVLVSVGKSNQTGMQCHYCSVKTKTFCRILDRQVTTGEVYNS